MMVPKVAIESCKLLLKKCLQQRVNLAPNKKHKFVSKLIWSWHDHSITWRQTEIMLITCKVAMIGNKKKYKVRSARTKTVFLHNSRFALFYEILNSKSSNWCPPVRNIGNSYQTSLPAQGFWDARQLNQTAR
jgi:hypothetical protein